MLVQSSMAFIGGWGFKSALLRESSLYLKGSFLIDLPNLEKLTLEKVSYNLSYLLPNNITLIGWSLGGLIAILLAAQFPKKVKKLILFSTSPCFIQTKGWSGISLVEANKFINLAEKNFNSLFNYFLSIVNYPNKILYYKDLLNKNSLNFEKYRNVLCKYLKILFESDLREAYKNIKIPLFYLLGEQDVIIKSQSQELYDLNPSAIIHLIPEAGHLAFLTHENHFYTRLLKFMNYV